MLDCLAFVWRRISLGMNLVHESKIMIKDNMDPRPIVVLGHLFFECTYLGQISPLNRNKFEKEAKRRVQIGWPVFRKLRQVLLLAIPQHLKTKVFDHCVLPVLTYGAKTWTLTIQLVQQFKVAQRAKLGVSLKNEIRNKVIQQITKAAVIASRIGKLKWQRAGHICLRTDNRWRTQVLEWRARLGKCSVRCPDGVTICGVCGRQ